ncbi:hypothetical protein BD779DRAFT_1522452 [Infundibulicybe gibba]|nr:hypothetical protein BD779DRAFT_1522452 [Infundibulicybe gibba]
MKSHIVADQPICPASVYISLALTAFENAQIAFRISRLTMTAYRPLKSLKGFPGTNVLDTRLAYDLFSQTVRYGAHCQGLQRVWITEDGYQAWALSSNRPEEGLARLEFEPPVYDTSPPF